MEVGVGVKIDVGVAVDARVAAAVGATVGVGVAQASAISGRSAPAAAIRAIETMGTLIEELPSTRIHRTRQAMAWHARPPIDYCHCPTLPYLADLTRPGSL